ncbi:MAG TPA: DUF2851 domain-containing protein [Cytophagales bacterium]|jgi:hypothetical protein|nr:DUF2851 domain-containing protein [Cytophagales bacterium]
MNESFLHYLWQFQYFDKSELVTSQGESLSVLKTGILNSNAGPDFFNAKIKIGDIDWVGNVEIHVKSSDWLAHHHEIDSAYDNVILHLVWENDKPIFHKNRELPTLELKARVADSIIKEYKRLISNPAAIACEKSFTKVDPIIKHSMLDKALMQRLEIKANNINELLKINLRDWDETTYQLLARNFGFKINADPFFQLSKTLPYKIIQKQNSLLQVEALLFGQAGILETKTKDEYISLLHREYHLLAQKYSLNNSRLNAAQWRFLRLRPSNFPTLRLSQLAAIVFASKNIFSKLIEVEIYESLKKIFEVDQSDYWKTHYRFGPKAKGAVPKIGESSIENIVINTVVPLLVAYGKDKDEQRYIDKAVDLLQQIPAEANKITRTWNELGLSIKNAFDSQALIELHNNFCQKRQCLNCNIGVSILKPLQ